MHTLFLKRGEDRRIRAGHAWVFSNEADVVRSPLTGFTPGEQINVADSAGRLLGSAYVNPASLIAARIYSPCPNTPLDAELLRSRLRDCLHLRERLFSVPWYRLCYGEADGLPGLVIDRHGEHLVVQISTAGMENLRPMLVDILNELLKPTSLLFANDLPSRALENLSRVVESHGPVPEYTDIFENGAAYRVALGAGQKTGWFYDQRPNRQAILPFVAQARVLDAFCYAGAFGTLAGKHGAASLTFLDSSAPALALAAENARRNAQNPELPIECLHGDAFGLLADLRREKREFDLVCLDPPAFIKRRKDAKQGLEAYRRVNDLALDLVAPQGLLMTCSCSHHLPAENLHSLVTKVALRKKRALRLLYQGFQGPDHPRHPSMPESEYLKVFLYECAAPSFTPRSAENMVDHAAEKGEPDSSEQA